MLTPLVGSISIARDGSGRCVIEGEATIRAKIVSDPVEGSTNVTDLLGAGLSHVLFQQPMLAATLLLFFCLTLAR